MRSINYVIDKKDSGKTIERFLRSMGFSVSVIADLKKTSNGVMLNGQPVYVIAKITEGDNLVVNIHELENSQNIVPENCGYSIVYEDDDYIVYDKPYGVVVHPTKVYQSKTLGNDFMFRCAIDDENLIFRPIYRIDRNTSGLVVVAKNKLSSATNVVKEYICICKNNLPLKGVIDSPISLCNDSKIKRCVSKDGQTAYTEFERIGCSNGYSVARVTLKTGRTHQIRVHFSSEGYPLVGDTLYGDDCSINRHALHCNTVSFRHMVSGQIINLSSTLPLDMMEFINKNDLLENN